ncbi:MAG: hypothetical protein HUK15_08625, partial [Bacteroidales bacterium]|nr:hypothetical protein [Bacteroidales bacterium]
MKNNKANFIYIPLLFVLCMAMAVFIFPTESQFEYSYQKGTQWLYDDLYAPYDFAISRTTIEIENEKDSIQQNFIPFYKYDSSVSEKFIRNYCELVTKIFNEKIGSAQKSHINGSEFVENMRTTMQNIYNNGVILLSEQSRKDKKIRIIRNDISELEFADDFHTPTTAQSEIQNLYHNNHNISSIDSLAGFPLRGLIEKMDFDANLTVDEE